MRTCRACEKRARSAVPYAASRGGGRKKKRPRFRRTTLAARLAFFRPERASTTDLVGLAAIRGDGGADDRRHKLKRRGTLLGVTAGHRRHDPQTPARCARSTSSPDAPLPDGAGVRDDVVAFSPR